MLNRYDALPGPQNEGNRRPPGARPARRAGQRGAYEAIPFVSGPGEGVGTIKHRSEHEKRYTEYILSSAPEVWAESDIGLGFDPISARAALQRCNFIV